MRPKLALFLILLSSAPSWGARKIATPILSVQAADRESTAARADFATTLSCRNVSPLSQTVAVKLEKISTDIMLYVANASGVTGYTNSGNWFRHLDMPMSSSVTTDFAFSLGAAGSSTDTKILSLSYFCNFTKTGAHCDPPPAPTFDFAMPAKQSNGEYVCTLPPAGTPIANCLSSVIAVYRSAVSVSVAEDRGAIQCGVSHAAILSSSPRGESGRVDAFLNGGRPF